MEWLEEKALDIGLGNDFFFFLMNPQSIGNKSKNRQKELYQTKSFCTAKKIVHRVKPQPIE